MGLGTRVLGYAPCERSDLLTHDRSEMLDGRRRLEERSDQCAPLRERRRLAKPYRMVLERPPLHPQRIAVGGFDRAAQLMPEIASAVAKHLDGGVKHRLKFRFAAMTNSKQCCFNNHCIAPMPWTPRRWRKDTVPPEHMLRLSNPRSPPLKCRLARQARARQPDE